MIDPAIIPNQPPASTAPKEPLATPSNKPESAPIPEKFAELRALARSYEDAMGFPDPGPLTDEDDDFFVYGIRYTPAFYGLQEHVCEWTKRIGISCPAIDNVATDIAGGLDYPSRPHTTIHHLDQDGNSIPVEEPPAIQARPFDETLPEFLDRARNHYAEVRQCYVNLGFDERPIKREIAHFRWLASNLVKGHTWAQIAETGQLNPHGLSEKSIAKEARTVADLIGIPLRTKRGPRPGSRHTPHSRRRRRYC
jgi:hypothetical protein